VCFFPLPLTIFGKPLIPFLLLILTAKTHFMRKFRLPSLLFLSILLIAVSCTKEGPEGPAGVAGLQGPPGVAGPVGPAGPQGPMGQTNVTFSPWFATGTGWTATGANVYGAQFLFDRASTVITQAIIDNGLVMGYIKGEPNTPSLASQAFQLPYLVGNGFGFLDQYELVLNAAGNIRFLYKSDFPWTAAQLAPVNFRYVVIPGSVAGGRGNAGVTTYAGYSAAQLKAMPYEQIAKLFNIPAEGTNIQ
jgi:hypothetical protein